MDRTYPSEPYTEEFHLIPNINIKLQMTMAITRTTKNHVGDRDSCDHILSSIND